MNTKNIAWGDLTYLKDIQAFTLNLQKGDLGLYDIIDYGICLYGKTKTGKTATSHIVSGNPVRGLKKDGQDMIQTTTSRNKKAKIGNTGNSQTLLPNFFDVKLKSIKNDKFRVCVIDTPGYGDTLSIFRILSIGYFHYRLYSKIRNMKFILCFQRSDINNTAQTFLDTVKKFTAYFNNYDSNAEIRQTIWKSCAFLITKVDQSDKIQQDLREKLQTVAVTLKQRNSRGQEDLVIQFIHFILKQNRFFYIKKIKNGKEAQQKDILQQIDRKITDWYKRAQTKHRQKQIDMSPISFNLAKQIIIQTTNQKRYKKQFQQLIIYYNKRLSQYLQAYVGLNNDFQGPKSKGSLYYVINQLVNDSMGSSDSHKFLNLMEGFKTKNYLYDPSYTYDRQKKQKQLFAVNDELNVNSNSFSKKKYNQKSYIVKKFQALTNIQNLKKEILKLSFQTRSVQWLQKVEQTVYKIIKQFNKVSYKKNKCAEIIYKYGYIIHRILEEAKLFTNLFQVGCTQQHKKTLQDNNGFILDFFTPLSAFMQLDLIYKEQDKTSAELKQLFIKNFDLSSESIKNLVINQQLINFFSPNKKPNDQQVVKKNILLVLRYADQIIQQIEEAQQRQQIITGDKKRMIKRLSIARINAQNYYHLNNADQKKTAQNVMLIRNITCNLGKILQYMQKYQTAKKVYQTIKYVQSVCRIFKRQLELQPKNIQLRVDYAQYLSNHCRQNEAIYILQQAYQLAQQKPQLENVKTQITQLKLKMRDKANINLYQDSLFNGEYFIQFSAQLEKQIQMKST